MRKKDERHPAPLFVLQNDPTARGLPKAKGQKAPIASRACVPRRGLERRKQGVIFQTKTYGYGSMPKQQRARMSKLSAYGLSRQVMLEGGDAARDPRHFDELEQENKKNVEFVKQKAREVVTFLRALASAKTPQEKAKIMRYKPFV